MRTRGPHAATPGCGVVGLGGGRRVTHSGLEVRDTGVRISALGLGTSTFGNLFRPMHDDDASAIVRRALELGIGYFDTAPVYGLGLAEQRLGRALAEVDRSRYVVSTKVGRLLRKDAPPNEALFHDGTPFFVDTPAVNPIWDFSARGAVSALEESLERMGLLHADIVFVHEPPTNLLDDAIRKAYPALASLRRRGDIGAIGVGWDRPDLMTAFVRATDCDCLLLASRYTLLDRTAERELLPLCAEQGMAVIVGGVFMSGVLADPRPGARFEYLPAPEGVLEQARELAAEARRHGVVLAAAALQFPRRHPAVASVLISVRNVAELEADVRLAAAPIPEGLWARLERPPRGRE